GRVRAGDDDAVGARVRLRDPLAVPGVGPDGAPRPGEARQIRVLPAVLEDRDVEAEAARGGGEGAAHVPAAEDPELLRGARRLDEDGHGAAALLSLPGRPPVREAVALEARLALRDGAPRVADDLGLERAAA